MDYREMILVCIFAGIGLVAVPVLIAMAGFAWQALRRKKEGAV